MDAVPVESGRIPLALSAGALAVILYLISLRHRDEHSTPSLAEDLQTYVVEPLKVAGQAVATPFVTFYELTKRDVDVPSLMEEFVDAGTVPETALTQQQQLLRLMERKVTYQ